MTMKSKTMRHAIKVKLFAAVLLATCVFAGAAKAETMAIKFNLPFEVHWGKNLLPAGEYSVTMDSSANVGLVRSANGKVAIYTPIPIKAYSRTGNTALYVLVRGIFFSSRRRHTRYWRDWSSDVCSSDLFGCILLAARKCATMNVRAHVS